MEWRSNVTPIISTRAPRTEGDPPILETMAIEFGFQPAPPARRATLREVYRNSFSQFQPAPPARRATPTAYLVVTQHETGPFART